MPRRILNPFLLKLTTGLYRYSTEVCCREQFNAGLSGREL